MARRRSSGANAIGPSDRFLHPVAVPKPSFLPLDSLSSHHATPKQDSRDLRAQAPEEGATSLGAHMCTVTTCSPTTRTRPRRPNPLSPHGPVHVSRQAGHLPKGMLAILFGPGAFPDA
jgi:hypothetical protein